MASCGSSARERFIPSKTMSVVFHGKISIRSLGVRGVVAASSNRYSEDRKFALAGSVKEEEISRVPS